jgi:serine/threonine protein phosphatase PrpC
MSLESGDVLLLCTDGLWGLLTEDEIQTAVAGKTAAEICNTLVDTAKRRGGPDNITMQVLRVN